VAIPWRTGFSFATELLRHAVAFHETSSSWTAREREVIQDPLKTEFRLNWILDVRAVHLQNDDLVSWPRVHFRPKQAARNDEAQLLRSEQ
jgi:hypothetical protein